MKHGRAMSLETGMIDCFSLTPIILHPRFPAVQIVSLAVIAYGPGSASQCVKKSRVGQSRIFSLESHHCYTNEVTYSKASVLRRIARILWFDSYLIRRKENAIFAAVLSQRSGEKALHQDKLALYFPRGCWTSFANQDKPWPNLELLRECNSLNHNSTALPPRYLDCG